MSNIKKFPGKKQKMDYLSDDQKAEFRAYLKSVLSDLEGRPLDDQVNFLFDKLYRLKFELLLSKSGYDLVEQDQINRL